MVPDDGVTSARDEIEKGDPNPSPPYNDGDDIEEKPAVEQREMPKLQRKLKSRHLQMIAIGKSTTSSETCDILTPRRWNDRNGSVYRERHGTGHCRPCWRINCVCLCGVDCIFGYGCLGRNCDVPPCAWRIYSLRDAAG